MKPSREEYGDWLLIINADMVVPFHTHTVEGPVRYYTVTTEFKCRDCGEKLPPGVQFRVRFLSVES